MKKLILILVIIVATLNLLYTFGYQGEPMSQFEFLTRALLSIAIVLGTLLLLKKLKVLVINSFSRSFIEISPIASSLINLKPSSTISFLSLLYNLNLLNYFIFYFDFNPKENLKWF